MNPPHLITSLANPRIKQVVKLRDHRHRQRTGQFIAEGIREIDRALTANLTCRELFICSALDLPLQETKQIKTHTPDAAHFIVSEPVFQKIAYTRNPQGILAVFDQPHFTFDTLPPVTHQTLYLIAVGTQKPGNLGAMARTAAAAGCDAMLAVDAVVDPFNPNAIRTSTGAVFSLPIIPATPLQVLDHLARHQVRLLAAMLDENAVAYTRADLRGPLAIAIGPEDAGLDESWRNAANQTHGHAIHIPMHNTLVDSLNAANAAAIILFEALRQRTP